MASKTTSSATKKRVVIVPLDTSDTINLDYLDVIPFIHGLDKSIVNVDIQNHRVIHDPTFNNNNVAVGPHGSKSNYYYFDPDVSKLCPELKQRGKKSIPQKIDLFNNNNNNNFGLQTSQKLIDQPAYSNNVDTSDKTFSIKNNNCNKLAKKEDSQSVEDYRGAKLGKKINQLLQRHTVTLADILNNNCNNNDEASNYTSTDEISQSTSICENEDGETLSTVPAQVCQNVCEKIRHLGLEDGLRTSEALVKITEALQDLQQSWELDFPTTEKIYKPPSRTITGPDVVTLCPNKVDPFICTSNDCSVVQILDNNIRELGSSSSTSDKESKTGVFILTENKPQPLIHSTCPSETKSATGIINSDNITSTTTKIKERQLSQLKMDGNFPDNNNNNPSQTTIIISNGGSGEKTFEVFSEHNSSDDIIISKQQSTLSNLFISINSENREEEPPLNSERKQIVTDDNNNNDEIMNNNESRVEMTTAPTESNHVRISHSSQENLEEEPENQLTSNDSKELQQSILKSVVSIPAPVNSAVEPDSDESLPSEGDQQDIFNEVEKNSIIIKETGAASSSEQHQNNVEICCSTKITADDDNYLGFPKFKNFQNLGQLFSRYGLPHTNDEKFLGFLAQFNRPEEQVRKSLVITDEPMGSNHPVITPLTVELIQERQFLSIITNNDPPTTTVKVKSSKLIQSCSKSNHDSIHHESTNAIIKKKKVRSTTAAEHVVINTKSSSHTEIPKLINDKQKNKEKKKSKKSLKQSNSNNDIIKKRDKDKTLTHEGNNNNHTENIQETIANYVKQELAALVRAKKKPGSLKDILRKMMITSDLKIVKSPSPQGGQHQLSKGKTSSSKNSVTPSSVNSNNNTKKTSSTVSTKSAKVNNNNSNNNVMSKKG